MNIETAALIRYDVCHQSNRDVLLRNLRTLYDDDGEKHGERVLGGDQWNRVKFEGPLNDMGEDFGNFAGTATYVSFESRHLIDIVSVAELSSGQIEEIQGSDPDRSQYLISELSECLSNIAEEIPTVAPTDFNQQPVQFYVEPTDPQPVTDDKGELDPDLLTVFLEDFREGLEGIHYHVDHPQSLLDGEDLVTPQGTAYPWGRLTVFNLRSPPSTESSFEPYWLRRLKPLREYLRTYLWLNHRRQLLATLDRDTHGIDQLMRNAPEDASQLEEILEIEDELDETRERWTDRYTKIVDEVADLQSRAPLHRHPREETEPVKINEITDGAPANSLLDVYGQQIAVQVEQVNSDLDRIGNKLDEVSSYIQDKINVRATRATIRQQRATNYLTIVIAILTIVLVGIGAIDLAIAVWGGDAGAWF